MLSPTEDEPEGPKQAILFRYCVDNSYHMGADLAFLSAFPKENEVLRSYSFLSYFFSFEVAKSILTGMHSPA